MVEVVSGVPLEVAELPAVAPEEALWLDVTSCVELEAVPSDVEGDPDEERSAGAVGGT